MDNFISLWYIHDYEILKFGVVGKKCQLQYFSYIYDPNLKGIELAQHTVFQYDFGISAPPPVTDLYGKDSWKELCYQRRPKSNYSTIQHDRSIWPIWDSCGRPVTTWPQPSPSSSLSLCQSLKACRQSMEWAKRVPPKGRSIPALSHQHCSTVQYTIAHCSTYHLPLLRQHHVRLLVSESDSARPHNQTAIADHLSAMP